MYKLLFLPSLFSSEITRARALERSLLTCVLARMHAASSHPPSGSSVESKPLNTAADSIRTEGRKKNEEAAAAAFMN